MDPNEYGLTQEEAEKAKDIVPTFDLANLDVGKTAAFKITESKPRTVKWTEKDTQEERESLVINAIDKLTNLEVALWLSSVSLRTEFYKLAKKHDGNIKDVHVVIAVREYDHEKWGKTRSYTVQEDKDVENYNLD